MNHKGTTGVWSHLNSCSLISASLYWSYRLRRYPMAQSSQQVSPKARETYHAYRAPGSFVLIFRVRDISVPPRCVRLHGWHQAIEC